MPESPKDVDPELLLESGRASAIQDLADQARAMGDRAVALEKSTQNALTQEVRRWRRTSRWSIAANVLLIIGLVILSGIGLTQLSISSDNKEILEDVEVLLEDVNTLVAFVENSQQRGDTQNQELQEVFRAIFEIREIVCVDPTFQTNEACQRLTNAGD